MTSPGDVNGEMIGSPFDDATAEALLRGTLHPDDAPPGTREIATLVRAAKAEAGPDELGGQEAMVAAFVAAAPGPQVVTPLTVERRRRVLAKALTVKGAAVTAAVLFAGSAAAASATGSLPAAIQARVSSGLAHVGISLPSPSSQANGHAPGTQGAAAHGAGQAGGPQSSQAVGPSATGPAAAGLCTAFTASGQSTQTNGNSTAFRNLEAAAAVAGQTVAQYCAALPTSSGSTSDSGGPPSSTPGNASPGSPSSSTPGNASPGSPPSSTPGNSGGHGASGSH